MTGSSGGLLKKRRSISNALNDISAYRASEQVSNIMYLKKNIENKNGKIREKLDDAQLWGVTDEAQVHLASHGMTFQHTGRQSMCQILCTCEKWKQFERLEKIG